MKSEDRKSIGNAIWLCSNCATKIDIDPNGYPANLLKAWKHDAEQAADSEKGRRLPSESDSRAELVAVLTGAANRILPNAIPNVHNATELAFSTIDPRLRVETSYSKEGTTFGVHALENIEVQLQIPPTLARNWSNGLTELMDHGEPVVLPAKDVSVRGSPVFDYIFSGMDAESTHVTIGSHHSKDATLKLGLSPSEGTDPEDFCHVSGKLFIGKKSVTFRGTAFGGVLAVSSKAALIPGDKEQLTFTAQFEKWNGVDVRSLPYFEKLRELFSRLSSGWKVQTVLEVEGLEVSRGSSGDTALPSRFGDTAEILRYTSYVRTVATKLNERVCMVLNQEISVEEVEHAREVAHILSGTRVFERGAISKPPTCTLIAGEDAKNIRSLVADEGSYFVAHVSQDREKFCAFGQTITLPPLCIYLEDVRPVIACSDLGQIKEGDTVLVEWELSSRGRCFLSYSAPNDELLQVPVKSVSAEVAIRDDR